MTTVVIDPGTLKPAVLHHTDTISHSADTFKPTISTSKALLWGTTWEVVAEAKAAAIFPLPLWSLLFWNVQELGSFMAMPPRLHGIIWSLKPLKLFCISQLSQWAGGRIQPVFSRIIFHNSCTPYNLTVSNYSHLLYHFSTLPLLTWCIRKFFVVGKMGIL